MAEVLYNEIKDVNGAMASILSAMVSKAQELKVTKGAAVVLFQSTPPSVFVVHEIHLGSNPNPQNYRYGANARGKIAQMQMTGENASRHLKENEEELNGIFAYRGGLNAHSIFIAFSGGTEDEDVEIAQAGLDDALKLLVN